MTEILQAFCGNPLGTFIGKKIEAATRPELESDDWALNLEICDCINENDNGAKDAVRAIKKRLQQIEHDRNFTITNRTLTVLETCVSNCSHRFHALVMTKDFIQDLVKLIGPKNNPPIELQERVLRMIERWAETFITQSSLSGVVTIYNELKAKGVTFPPKDETSNVPIRTPQRSVPPQAPAVGRASSPPDIAASFIPQEYIQPSGPVVLEGEGYNKITRDLGVVQSSVEMFDEILGLLESKNDDSDWKLAADLNTTCRQMKERIVDLIERVANEDLTIELLRLNDELNNIFIKYDRLIKNRSKILNPATQVALDVGGNIPSTASATTKTPTPTRPVEEPSLIDFNADESRDNLSEDKKITTTTSTIAPGQSVSQQTAIDASLARLSLNTKPQTSVKATGLPEEISSVREQDFDEIEKWLSTNSCDDPTSRSDAEPISIPNSEFENFIASRALAGGSARPDSSPNQSGNNKTKLEPSM